MGRKIGTFGLVNYKRHPQNHNYIVFNFNSLQEATLFESELIKNKVWYEKDIEVIDAKEMYLYAVQDGSLDKATRANSAVMMAFKKPMVKHKILRYSLLIIFAGLVAFALIGYVKNNKNVSKETNKTEQDSL